MARYRKKPVEIEAVQWPINEMFPAWLTSAIDGGTVVGWGGDDLLIETLEGQMRCTTGDWIIQGVKGELYPCKPDIFAATYEPVGAVSTDDTEQTEGFYEEDEPVADVIAAFDAGEKHLTAPPARNRSTATTTIAYPLGGDDTEQQQRCDHGRTARHAHWQAGPHGKPLWCPGPVGGVQPDQQRPCASCGSTNNNGVSCFNCGRSDTDE